jgi:hypothetical protein
MLWTKRTPSRTAARRIPKTPYAKQNKLQNKWSRKSLIFNELRTRRSETVTVCFFFSGSRREQGSGEAKPYAAAIRRMAGILLSEKQRHFLTPCFRADSSVAYGICDKRLNG